MTLLLLALLVGGLSAAASGWFLRSRRVRAEHWLWKKRRLRRARILTASGAVATTVSTAGLLLGSVGLIA
jgi:Na+/proline symporter